MRGLDTWIVNVIRVRLVSLLTENENVILDITAHTK